MTVSLSTAVRNAEGDAIVTAIGNTAKLRIYDGTPPASANAALSGNNQLAELICSNPFAPATSGGVITANTIADDASADATGTASFFRIYKADGTTCQVQGSVGTSGADLNLNSTSIVAGGIVHVSSLTLTEGSP